MRLAGLCLAVLVLAGCGAPERTAGPASSGEGTTSVEHPLTVPTTAIEKPNLKPPPIVLVSAEGKQKAVQGSFCVDYVDQASGAGQGMCGDSAVVHPNAVTAVRHGDEVTFVFPGARIVRPDGCHSDEERSCIGSVAVRPLGCEDRVIESLPLLPGAETRWRVDLDPGAYELDVFGYFESGDGATGDVSGSLGLTVAGAKSGDALGVLAIEPSMQVCEFGG